MNLMAVFKVLDTTSGEARLLVVPVKPTQQTSAYRGQLLSDLRKAHVENARKRGCVRSDRALRDEVQHIGLFDHVQEAVSIDEALQMA